MKIELTPIEGMPEIETGDEIGTMLADRMMKRLECLDENVVVVVAQKIIAKSEGLEIPIDSIDPGERARTLSEKVQKDPRTVQVILDHSEKIVTLKQGVIISETKHGFVCANAGLDTSNVKGEGTILPLPRDPDRSAQRIRHDIGKRFESTPGVVITDTWGRPWRIGQVNFAIGVAGFNPIRDYRGTKDTQGQVMSETMIAEADELAGAAELVMGKTRDVPAVIIGGYQSPGSEGSYDDLIRPRDRDFFRD